MKTVCKKLFSLMLVAILLVSAIPFQAFAATGDPATVTVYWYDGTTYVAQNGGNVVEGDTFDVAAYTAANFAPGWDYTVTGYYHNGTAEANKINGSATLVAGENKFYTYTVHSDGILTLVTNDATIQTMPVEYGKAVTLPANPTLANYTFQGWFSAPNGEGTKLVNGATWTHNGDATYYAYFTPNMNTLTISAVKIVDGVQKESYTLGTDSLMENEPLLQYLITNWNDDVAASVPTGYKWETNNKWYKNQASTPLEDQDTVASANRAVFVKFIAQEYTLHFDANGGTVNPTSKKVVYDKAIGELPTPSCDGKVFSHWEDEAGNKVTSSTIYQTAGNSTLKAVYKGEIKVNLHMHTEKSKTGGLIAPLSGYVAGDQINQTIAMNVVKNYYSGNMTFVGLFDTSDWNQYVEGKLPTGKNFINIPTDAAGTYTIHVMINNGTLGTGGNTTDPTTTPTTGNNATNPTTKPADKTNPSTGDTMLSSVLPVMMISAAALVVMMQLRKRKMI